MLGIGEHAEDHVDEALRGRVPPILQVREVRLNDLSRVHAFRP
jgi:hypothetical protein